MKKNYLPHVLTLALIISSFIFASNVSADSVQTKSANISNFQGSAPAIGRINVSFSIKNVSETSLTDTNFYLVLQAEPIQEKLSNGVINVKIQPVIAKYQNTSSFELKPGEEKKYSFSFDYPVSIKEGKYQLSLFVKNSLGLEIYSSYAIFVDLKGNSTGLIVPLEKCRVIDKDGKEYPTYQGALFDPGDEPKVKCTVTNPQNSPVEFTARYQTNIMHVLSYKPSDGVASASLEVYSFKASETKEVILTLPKKTEPQIYETFCQFVKKGTNEVISPYLVFRWTIKGAAARINKVEANPFKSHYEKGEKINITADYVPSPDIWWRQIDSNQGTNLSNAKITFVLYGTFGKVCAKTEKDLGNVTNVVTGEQAELTVGSSCNAKKLSAQILQNGNVLASYDLPFPSKQGINTIYFLSIILIVAVLIILAYALKKRIKKKYLIAIIVAIVCFVLIFMVLLATAYAYDISDVVNILAQKYNTNNITGLAVHLRFITSNFVAAVTDSSIPDYEYGSHPESPFVTANYLTYGSLCDNDNVFIYLTFYIVGEQSKTNKIYRIDNALGGVNEVGYWTQDLSNWNSVFGTLNVGPHYVRVEARDIVLSHDGYEPAAEGISKYAVHDSAHSLCVFRKEASGDPVLTGPDGGAVEDYDSEMDSYASGWGKSLDSNPDSYTYCGSSGSSNATQYMYAPIYFDIPFNVLDRPPVNGACGPAATQYAY